MFLTLLAPAQQRLFYEAARAIVEADGTSAEAEVAQLDAIVLECELEEVPERRDVEGVLADLRGALDGPATTVFLMELAGVSTVDGHMHPSELQIIQQVGEAAGATSKHVDECFAFAERARQLVVDGRALIASGADA